MFPKPFIRLADGQSLLQKAFLRSASLPTITQILTVTSRDLYFKIEDEFQEVNQKHIATSYILEPFGRNTAAAIATAAVLVREAHGDEACLLVLAADHLVTDLDAFGKAVASAWELAAHGDLVTFGIPPDSPETGYGYIETSGSKVVRFVEKPTLERARQFVKSGGYYWNSGMFLFQAGAILNEMERHSPEILRATNLCLAHSRRLGGSGEMYVELDSATFEAVPSDSIDYAVMEKSERVSVVPCDMGWSDIGSWTALGGLTEPDEQGNRVQGETVLLDTTDCIIKSEDRLVGALGVRDLVVIDTPDALLVASKSRVQDVKQLYAELKARDHEAHKIHRTVHRPWGSYTVLEQGDGFKIKRIVVRPGGSLSLQMHHHRSEHWIVVGGMARVVNGDQEMFVGVNESTYIPAGHRHRLSNPGLLDLMMIEVQSGDYLEEDDIVRFDDDYGRN
jgi:mannose-1-phosphate guanylyltransferase/mannose-6-phosphate isomerase